MTLTRGQKAAQTRREHDAAIRAKRHAEEERRASAIQAMEDVLRNGDTTPSERIEAARLLLEWSKLR